MPSCLKSAWIILFFWAIVCYIWWKNIPSLLYPITIGLSAVPHCQSCRRQYYLILILCKTCTVDTRGTWNKMRYVTQDWSMPHAIVSLPWFVVALIQFKLLLVFESLLFLLLCPFVFLLLGYLFMLLFMLISLLLFPFLSFYPQFWFLFLYPT